MFPFRNAIERACLPVTALRPVSRGLPSEKVYIRTHLLVDLGAPPVEVFCYAGIDEGEENGKKTKGKTRIKSR